MAQWILFENGDTDRAYVLLRRVTLAESSRQELLDQARSFELRKCSGLRKDKLIDRIVACISPTAVSVNEVADAMQLYWYWLGYFEDPTDN